MKNDGTKLTLSAKRHPLLPMTVFAIARASVVVCNNAWAVKRSGKGFSHLWFLPIICLRANIQAASVFRGFEAAMCHILCRISAENFGKNLNSGSWR